MKRFILDDLIKWKNSKYRKPLILRGIRFVGKTWILQEFGRLYYKNIVYFNFEENIKHHDFFKTTKNPERILEYLMLVSGQKIEPENTLIIFDEIELCPDALNSLKYFCENAPEYHVVSATSFWKVNLNRPASFPVGKVDFLDIYPMTFSEFLIANGDENLKLFLDSVEDIEKIPEAFYNPLYEKLKMYYISGGMPESVLMWTKERNIDLVMSSLNNIIEASEKTNLVSKVFRISAPRLPLSAYDDLSAFKLYLVDVGLLNRLSLLSPTAFGEGNRLFTEIKRALTENYILQSLIPQFEVTPRYWSDNVYEVDFIMQNENDVLPVEVKAEKNTKGKSLFKFKEKYSNDVKLRVRFSFDNLTLDGDLLNIPLFMADYSKKLINIALNKKKER